MKVFNTSFTLSSEEGTEVTDITKLVREAIQQFPVSAGIALINTLHTTCAVFINEFQSALIDDLKGLVEKLVPERHGYRHDDPRFSDCERGNAHRLRPVGVGTGVALLTGPDDQHDDPDNRERDQKPPSRFADVVQATERFVAGFRDERKPS